MGEPNIELEYKRKVLTHPQEALFNTPRAQSYLDIRSSLSEERKRVLLERAEANGLLPFPQARPLALDPEGKILERFLHQNGFAKMIISQYNQWVRYGILATFQSIPILPMKNGMRVRVTDVIAIHPMKENGQPMFPSDARLHSISYMFGLRLGLTFTAPDQAGLETKLTVEAGGQVPVMIGSEVCNLSKIPREKYDAVGESRVSPGGYFTVVGRDRIVEASDNLRIGNIYVIKKKLVECRMTTRTAYGSRIIVMTVAKKDLTFRIFPSLLKGDTRGFNIVRAFRILGRAPTSNFLPPGYEGATQPGPYTQMSFDEIRRDIITLVQACTRPEFRDRVIQTIIPSLFDPALLEEEDDIAYLLSLRTEKGTKKKEKEERTLTKSEVEIREEYRQAARLRAEEEGFDENLDHTLAENRFVEEMFPQFRQDQTWEKRYMLAMMVARLAAVTAGLQPVDNWDSWANKRLETASSKMETLFSRIWRSFVAKHLNKMIVESDNPMLIKTLFEGTFRKEVTRSFIAAFKKGLWNISAPGRARDNVSKVIRTESALGYYAQILNITTNASRQTRNINVRGVQDSSIGFIDPSDTTESDACGLVKQPAVGCYISIDRPDNVTALLKEVLVAERDNDQHPDLLFLNGVFKGWVDKIRIRETISISNPEFETRVSPDAATIIFINPPPDSAVFKEVIAQIRASPEAQTAANRTIVQNGAWLEHDLPYEVTYHYLQTCINNGYLKTNLHNPYLRTRVDILVPEEGADATISSILEPVEWVSNVPSVERPNIFLLDGKFQGWCDGPALKAQLLTWRRSKTIAYDAGIIFDDDGYLRLYIDRARLLRPLLIVRQGPGQHEQSLVIDQEQLWDADFDTLLERGAIEYIDSLEQDQSSILIATSTAEVRAWNEDYARISGLIASGTLDGFQLDRARKNLAILAKESYTHCEVDPSSILGAIVGSAPHPDHEVGPRNTFQASMSKQNKGIYDTAYPERTDEAKVLINPTVSFYDTQLTRIIGLDKAAGGVTVTLAMMDAEGMNIEDSFIFSQALVDSGKLDVLKFIRHPVIKAKNEELGVPWDEIKPLDRWKYGDINEKTGIIERGTKVREGQCLVAKFFYDAESGRRRNTSEFVPKGEGGSIINKTFRTPPRSSNNNLNEEVQIIVHLRRYRKPRVGDKFAIRYSQKGTLSAIWRTEDMPVIATGPGAGTIVEVLMNPLAIPSRMTYGVPMEMIGTKFALMTGERINATAFRYFRTEPIEARLKEYGYSGHTEILMNPQTGEEIRYYTDAQTRKQVPIAVGPIFLLSLRHDVDDKIQERGRGLVGPARQPNQGRQRGGGIRFGEMERDAIISHGASFVLLDRLCYSSDAYPVVVCQQCGLVSPPREKIDEGQNFRYFCPQCNRQSTFARVTVPFALVRIVQIASIMNIEIRFKTTPIAEM